MSTKKREAFEWIKPENLDPSLKREFLVKVVAKTPSKTDHTKDMTIPAADRVVRIYPKQELEAAARSLAMRHIDFNHDMKRIIPEALVVDAEWFDERVEALLYIPNLEIINTLKTGKFNGFSVEESVREEEKTEEGMVQKGMTYIGLAIVEPPFKAGDPNANVAEFFETNGIKFEALLESEIVGEPKVEAIVEETDKLKKEIQDKTDKLAVVEKTLKDTEEGFKKVKEAFETAEKNKSVDIEKARKEARKEIADQIIEQLPEGYLKQRMPMNAQVFVNKIHRIAHEAKQ